MAKIKFKGEDGIFSKIGKRNLLILCAVLLIGGAVVLNYFLFSGQDKVDYDGSGMTDAEPDGESTPTTDTYFSAALLSRDQARDEALAVLQTVLDSEDALEETKTQALTDISRIALEIEKEANIESLIRARGFEDCIAVLSGENASIIVKSETELLQNHVAQISEIVYEQAGVLPANVKIICK
ncbi:MAG: SpoIIIAH-like family protein [Ruminococcaceae bacterium]|nr:SpoIIIAH-like family protein [Oscillospiraceae bacterium]